VSGSARFPEACAERAKTSRLVALRLSEELDAADARLLLKHLVACPSCFADAVAADPTLLFARLSASVEAEEAAASAGHRPRRGTREEAPEADVLAVDVLAAIRLRATEGSHGAAPRVRAAVGPWLKAAAVVALASGVAAVLVFRRPLAPAVPGAEVPPAVASGAFTRPLIEELGNPGARVYQFAGSALGEPTVIFVANPNADL
jgi:hypothetical protein